MDELRLFLYRAPPFDEVVSAADTAARSVALASAQQELDTRLAHWRKAAGLDSKATRIAGVGGYIGFFVVIYFVLPLIAPVVLLLLIALLLLFIPRWVRRAKIRRLLRCADARQCPECGYDLSGVVIAAPQAAALGPPTCPECGATWPLIPAAVPI